jgi:hypothetical protein
MSIYCTYRDLESVTSLSAQPRATTLDGLPFFITTISLGRELDDRMERYFNVWQFILRQVVEVRVSKVGIRIRTPVGGRPDAQASQDCLMANDKDVLLHF